MPITLYLTNNFYTILADIKRVQRNNEGAEPLNNKEPAPSVFLPSRPVFVSSLTNLTNFSPLRHEKRE